MRHINWLLIAKGHHAELCVQMRQRQASKIVRRQHPVCTVKRSAGFHDAATKNVLRNSFYPKNTTNPILPWPNLTGWLLVYSPEGVISG